MYDPEVLRMVQKLRIDMYEGDGGKNPPMTVRMARVEDAVSRSEQLVKTMFKIALGAIGTALATFGGDVLWNHLK